MQVYLVESTWGSSRLNVKLNEALKELDARGFEIVDIKYQHSFWGYSAMIQYN